MTTVDLILIVFTIIPGVGFFLCIVVLLFKDLADARRERVAQIAAAMAQITTVKSSK